MAKVIAADIKCGIKIKLLLIQAWENSLINYFKETNLNN